MLMLSISFICCKMDKVSMQEDEQIERDSIFYEMTENVLVELDTRDLQENINIIETLENLIPLYKNNWNYGNAIHVINIAKGRMALDSRKINEAKFYLIQAAETNGSPTLNSFGPDLFLAKKLLEENEKLVVVKYLNLCKKFWRSGQGRIEKWKKDIRNNQTPNFDEHLLYH